MKKFVDSHKNNINNEQIVLFTIDRNLCNAAREKVNIIKRQKTQHNNWLETITFERIGLRTPQVMQNESVIDPLCSKATKKNNLNKLQTKKNR
jgi:hypothetical protein